MQQTKMTNATMNYSFQLYANDNSIVLLSEKIQAMLNSSVQSESLKDQDVSIQDDSNYSSLNLSITIPAGQHITLIDDTEKFNTARISMTITLQEHSRLDYSLKVIDTFRTHLANQELTAKQTLTQEKLIKNLHFIFRGASAQATIKCSYLASNKRSFKLATIQDHVVGNTKSDLIVKGVFEGQSQFFCDNLIRISQNAQQVKAYQVNKNIVLSRSARAVSIPKLEVLAHDVKCQHGAATSRIDDNQLFYLQSRGIPLQQAEEMLIYAFLS